MRTVGALITIVVFLTSTPTILAQEDQRPRARELGIDVGILPTGQHNSITDVPGVSVGHKTIIRGDDIRTGVTVILPHNGNAYQHKTPAAVYLGNAFGKLAGSTQIQELGNIETPIGLTNTLSVSTVVRALVQYTLDQPENHNVRSVNAVVGETNDGFLNDIRGMHVSQQDVLEAIASATGDQIEEGCVGAGTGTVCFGFKGGIGTSSRKLSSELGGHIVGVLVQTNYGGVLTVNGAPVGRELNQFAFSRLTRDSGDGSCMIVVATDAPLSPRNLHRMAKRTLFGLARTGSMMSNGSGDYVIAFSTGYTIDNGTAAPKLLQNEQMTPLFLAAAEATEEAVYNSLLKATTMAGRNGNTVEAISIPRVRELLAKYNLLDLQDRLPGLRDDP